MSLVYILVHAVGFVAGAPLLALIPELTGSTLESSWMVMTTVVLRIYISLRIAWGFEVGQVPC